MKQLFLMRHGESGFLETKDFDRSLTEKGILSLRRIGKVLENRNIKIDLAICSPSKRTRQTLQLIRENQEIQECIFKEEIYLGGYEELIKLINKIPFSVNSCILIGHNPAISFLLSTLTGQNFFVMEPGRLAQLTLFISDWNGVGIGTGYLVDSWPKE